MAENPKADPQTVVQEQPLRVFVSSSVVGYEDLLDGIFTQLALEGFEVCMSHKGTVPVSSSEQAFTSCLRTVEECDLFLGLVLPRYGSGATKDEPLGITHREMEQAIALDMPRWFLVHEHVVVANKMLRMFRDRSQNDVFTLNKGCDFEPNEFLDDLRILDMYNAVLQPGVKPVSKRKGNWIQTFGSEADAVLFVSAQFRRHRELFNQLRQLLPKDRITDQQ